MHVKATVNYHVASHDQQEFVFDVDGISGNIIAPTLVTTEVEVKDIRDNINSVNFDNDGIQFVDAPTQVESFNDPLHWKNLYDREVTALLQNKIGAEDVIVFDHTVRIDAPDAVRKPARNVHNDYSKIAAEQRLIDLIGHSKAKAYQEGCFGFVNIWRPIDYPIPSAPLGFIRPDSMTQEDWVPIELRYPDRQGQILGAKPNPKHQWFYQSNMSPDDAIIFNIYDNSGRSHLAHSALDMVDQKPNHLPRKSIETRTLVKYAC